MNRTLVKICGITREEDGLLAAEAGADAVGFVFYAMSPRRVEVARAKEIAAVLPPFVLRVGVFVDATRGQMLRTADEVGLDMLQLHGDEPRGGLRRPAPARAQGGAGGPGLHAPTTPCGTPTTPRGWWWTPGSWERR